MSDKPKDTAAAQVGEPHETHSVDFLEGVAEGTAATIERCAQRLEELAPGGANFLDAAAAIRKLKDSAA